MSTLVERGDVFFFYRPRVEASEVDDLEDVQRFFLILKPDGRRLYRVIVVGPKRLPEPSRHERTWAFVAETATRPAVVRDELEQKTYPTKTRGTRVEQEARPAGEGRYAIVDHDGHTHLAYALELPTEPGPAQRAFHITKEASYIIAVRNPDAPAPPGAGLRPDRRAAYPEELLERFRGRRFIPVDTPALLDYEGAVVVLIGASEDPGDELGIELDAEEERLADADIFRELRLRPGELPVDPLERGELL
jgi:hypothetical protein